jgi:hypothetical protein
MANEVINGTLDLEVPGAITPINSLTIDVQSFATIANELASHFIVTRDIGAAPPNGQIQFSVRGDGQVFARGIDLEVPGATTPINSLIIDVQSFATVANELASHFIIARDIGAAPPNGAINFSVRGDGRVFARGGISFPDSTVQTTASPPPHVVLGEAAAGGSVSVLRTAGNVGIAGLSQNTSGGGLIGLRSSGGQQGVVLSESAGKSGFIAVFGLAGQQAVQLSAIQGSPNNGAISVFDAAGAAANTAKAQMFVDENGRGTLVADVKHFRVPNPALADTDIVYACIEGPEAAAYIRGTAELVNGACTVALPDHFAGVIAERGMTVHVTPLSAESLGLAVVQKSPRSLVIQELHSGTGTYSFDWEVKGIRAGYEDYQVIRPQSERNLVDYQPEVSPL